ncbi:MAG: DUF5658 family protein [Haloarculaceae archaeon]
MRNTVERALPGYVESVYALVLVWGLGDVVSTYIAVSAVGHAGMEANPWMRLLLETEPLLVVVVKAAVVLSAGIVLLACRALVERVPGWQVWFAGVVVGGWAVVVNNLAIAIAALA